MKHDIKIGELAELCGVSRDTIRFYERVGLLGQPSRTASRHRVYDEQAVAQLRLIRGLQGLGLSLEDIRHLLRLCPARELEAGKRIIRLLRARVDAIDSKISKLQAFRLRLDESLCLCEVSPFALFRFWNALPPTASPRVPSMVKYRKKRSPGTNRREPQRWPELFFHRRAKTNALSTLYRRRAMPTPLRGGLRSLFDTFCVLWPGGSFPGRPPASPA